MQNRVDTQLFAVIIVAIVVLVAVCALTTGYVRRERFSRHEVQEKAYKSCYKIAMQHMRYTQAAQKARAEGRLLVVIGNPSGGWVNQVVQGNECGDVCIDLKGCAGCDDGGPNGPTRVVKGDALAGLKTVPTNGAVVFESEVLEYVKDLPAVLAEIDRVTGKDRTRVFAVHTIGIADDAWNYHTKGDPPARPPDKYLEERKEDRWKYHKALGEGLAERVFYRFPPQDPYTWADL